MGWGIVCSWGGGSELEEVWRCFQAVLGKGEREEMHTQRLPWPGAFLLQQPHSPMGMGDSAFFRLQGRGAHTAERHPPPPRVWGCTLDAHIKSESN